MHLRMRSVAAIVVLAAMSGVLHATVSVPVEFGAMVRDSQLVVHGRVIDVRSQQTTDRRSIETVVTMSVTEALKGRPGGDVTFRMPGGEVGRYRRVMVGVPRFAPGDEVVVFLRGGAPALPTVFGLEQGLFRVTPGPDGRATVAPAPITAPASGSVRVVRGDAARRPVALETFVRDVRARAAVQP
jgi:hypothetical protein